MTTRKDTTMRASIFPQRLGRAAGAAIAAASIALLAACAPGEAPGEAAEGDTPAPSQFAEAEIVPVSGSSVSGIIRFDQDDEFLDVQGRISGLTAGAYGLRVHETQDCTSVDASSAGPVLSTDRDAPGLALDPDLPNAAGNLGDIVAGEAGTAVFEFVDTELTLGAGDHSIVGRTIVIHTAVEDVGPDGLPVLAGKPVGCGEIEPILTPTYVP